MEYENWTRKYVDVLKEWGFQPTAKKATSHRKWRYSGPETERTVTVIVPAKIKSSSRAATIANVKRQLNKAGASKQSIARFDRIALGLIQVEAGDTTGALEEKLEAAIKNQGSLIAAKIAFELGKRLGAEGARSSAIEKREQEIEAANEFSMLVYEIERILRRRMQGMFNRQIEASGYIEIGESRRFGVGRVSIEDALVHEFGFSIERTHSGSSSDIELTGVLVGGLAAHFEPWVKSPRFEATIEDEDGEGWIYCRDGNDVCSVRVSALDHLKKDALEAILKALEEEQTMMGLSGRLASLASDD